MKLFYLLNFITILSASGGYDSGTSAGKNKLDLSFTLNPFNYFEQGQSYLVVGYGITDNLDIHAYYSSSRHNEENYYIGTFYQFYRSKKIDIATAIGLRKFQNQKEIHFFVPQLLYSVKINQDFTIGGSLVDIRSNDLESRLGIAIDTFISYNIIENNKYKLDFTIGLFKPALWEPKNGDFYPTYSIDIKIK